MATAERMGGARISARVGHFVRAPEPSSRHRTIARVALLLLVAGTLAGTSVAATKPWEAPPGSADRIIFPLVGPAQWTDDFGDPRPQGPHQGNDIVTERRAPVVAVESGKIKFWATSVAAGCMLYLYGKSGATYLYIHLNDDLTEKNDNRGKCVPGIAYAPGLKDGQRVKAGDFIAFAGDSGDANGYPHLHFEVHPGDGAAISPFPWLKRAERLLYVLSDEEKALATAGEATLTLTGAVTSVEDVELPPAETVPDEEPAADSPPSTETVAQTTAPPPAPPAGRIVAGTVLTIEVSAATLSTGGSWRIERAVTLVVTPDAVVERTKGGKTKSTKLSTAEPGESVAVTTAPIELSLQTQLARPGVLSAAIVELLGKPSPERR
jgi:hypothetical protein